MIICNVHANYRLNYHVPLENIKKGKVNIFLTDQIIFTFQHSFNTTKMAAGPYNYSYIFKYIIIGE